MSKSALLLSPCRTWAGSGAKWYNEEVVAAPERTDGVLFHEQADMIVKTGCHYPALPEKVGIMVAHAEKYLRDELVPRCHVLQSEVAVGVNWITGDTERLPEVKGRGYPDRKGWQFGTADLVGILTTGELLIADWKTGGKDGAKEQLLSLACALQEATWAYENLCRGLRPVITLCLQVNEHGVWPEEHSVSQEELENHWEAMRQLWQVIDEPTEPVPGVHCTALYCPHLAYCDRIARVTDELALSDPGEKGPNVRTGDLMKYKVTDEPSDSLEAGFTQAMVSAANRRLKYLTESNKLRVKRGETVEYEGYEWKDIGNGFRWHKKAQ